MSMSVDRFRYSAPKCGWPCDQMCECVAVGHWPADVVLLVTYHYNEHCCPVDVAHNNMGEALPHLAMFNRADKLFVYVRSEDVPLWFEKSPTLAWPWLMEYAMYPIQDRKYLYEVVLHSNYPDGRVHAAVVEAFGGPIVVQPPGGWVNLGRETFANHIVLANSDEQAKMDELVDRGSLSLNGVNFRVRFIRGPN